MLHDHNEADYSIASLESLRPRHTAAIIIAVAQTANCTAVLSMVAIIYTYGKMNHLAMNAILQ